MLYMEVLLISVVIVMLQEMKYRVDDAKDYLASVSIESQEQVKYWLVLILMPLIAPLAIFCHESGHAMVGTLLGLEIRRFVVGFSGGYTSFDYSALMELTPLGIYLLFVVGGVFESLMYFALGKKLFRGFYVGIILSLSYGLWEGMKGLILLMEPSEGIVLLHMAALEPILNIAQLIATGILVYKVLMSPEGSD